MTMAKIKIEFPDKSSKEFEEGISPIEIAKDLGEKLAQDALAANFNGKLIDMTTTLTTSGKLQILTWDDNYSSLQISIMPKITCPHCEQEVEVSKSGVFVIHRR